MKRLGLTVVAAGVFTLGIAGSLSAQYGVGIRYSRPTVSPYLELTTGFGGGTGTSYFTRVRPAIVQQQINQSAQQTFEQLQRAQLQTGQSNRVSPRGREPIRATGHPAGFMFYGNYYPALSRR